MFSGLRETVAFAERFGDRTKGIFSAVGNSDDDDKPWIGCAGIVGSGDYQGSLRDDGVFGSRKDWNSTILA